MEAIDDFTVESSGQPDAGIIPEVQADAVSEADTAETPLAVSTDDATDDGEVAAEAVSDDAAHRDEQGRFAKKDKPRDNPIARINQLTAKHAEAERRAADAEARLREFEQARPATRIDTSAAFPDFSAWASRPGNAERVYEDYIDERADHRAAIRDAKARDERQGQAMRSKATTYQAEQQRRVAERPELKAAYEATASIPLTETLRHVILGSDRSNDLADYLALHPEEYAQLAAESVDDTDPVVAAKWMRRLLESKVTAAAPAVSAPKAPISAAKPPIKTVGSSPTPADPFAITDDLDVDEHIRRMNALDRKKRDQRRGL